MASLSLDPVNGRWKVGIDGSVLVPYQSPTLRPSGDTLTRDRRHGRPLVSFCTRPLAVVDMYLRVIYRQLPHSLVTDSWGCQKTCWRVKGDGGRCLSKFRGRTISLGLK